MADAAWIKQNFPGYAGWNDANAIVADYNATGGAGKGGSTGGTGGSSSSGRYVGSIDPSQVPSTLDYMEKLNTTEDAALRDLIMTMKARKSPLDVYTELETASGLPQLRTAGTSLAKEIGNLEDVLETVEPDVAARSRESLMTEAQRRGVVAERREPLLERLGKFTTNLGRLKELIGMTESGISTKANLFMQGQEMQMEPAKLQYQALVDRNARLVTGFTSDKETKLTILMDKLNRERELSDQEWQLMNSLKSEERTYLRQLQTAAANAGYKVTGAETADQLLGIVGSKAAEEIAYNRNKSGSGATTTATKNAAIKQLAQEASGTTGLSLADAQKKYAGVLSVDEIVKIYQASTGRGAVVEPYAQEILGTTPKTASGSSLYDDILGLSYYGLNTVKQ